jgi:hypothetical protein
VMESSAATETPVGLAQLPDHPQQPEVQTEERQASPETEDWLGETYAGFYNRMERLEGEIHLAHGYSGRNEQRGLVVHRSRKRLRSRRPCKGAPAVNALLNSAIVPPIGYHGDVCAVVRDRALPGDELRLHELSQACREAYHAVHDKEHADNEEILKAGKRAGKKATATSEDVYVRRFYEHLTELEMVEEVRVFQEDGTTWRLAMDTKRVKRAPTMCEEVVCEGTM